jgi:hypothetical protein
MPTFLVAAETAEPSCLRLYVWETLRRKRQLLCRHLKIDQKKKKRPRGCSEKEVKSLAVVIPNL